MTEALHVVGSLIAGLFGLVVTAIKAVEDGLRSLLTQIGVTGQLQTAVLAIVVLLLVVAAFRVFGRVFAILILVFLLLLLAHMLVPHEVIHV